MSEEPKPEAHDAPKINKPAVAVLYAAFVLVTIIGCVVARGGESFGLEPMMIAVAAFAAVIAASMLMSWGAEAGEFLISQGAIVAIIALLQVLPEFMVEAVIAWDLDTPNMLANLTGSNRLLMGLGWPMIYTVAMVSHFVKTKRRLGPIELRPEHAIEVWALILSSGYFLVILWRGSFVWWDGVILIAFYIAYFILLTRLPAEEEEGKEELLAPSAVLVDFPKRTCLGLITALLALGGFAMIAVAHPFVDAMKHVAGRFQIPQFFFVQWVAPFLTEFPEKVTAFYWAKRVTRANVALLNMVSSKVNQWTLLAGMVPLVYSASMAYKGKGGFFTSPVPISDHAIEVWLSLAMTMYGAATLLKRRFTGLNCLVLFSLWFIQFVNPTPQNSLIEHLGPIDFTKLDMRYWTTVIFAVLTPIELIAHARSSTPLQDLKEILRLLRRR